MHLAELIGCQSKLLPKQYAIQNQEPSFDPRYR